MSLFVFYIRDSFEEYRKKLINLSSNSNINSIILPYIKKPMLVHKREYIYNYVKSFVKEDLKTWQLKYLQFTELNIILQAYKVLNKKYEK